MRMGAFLRDGGSLHQSAVDVPIDLAIRVNDLVGIILRDDRNGFVFAPQGLEAKPRIGLCCMAYGLLAHRSHWLYREGSPRLFGDCLRRLLRDRARRLFRHRLRRLFGDRLRWLLLDGLCRLPRGSGHSLFRDRFYRLIRGTRCRLLRNHLNHVVRLLLIVTRKVQRWRGQRLRAKRCAGNDKKRCSCECPEGTSFLHEGEVMPGIVPLGKLFFRFFLRSSAAQKPVCRKAAAAIFSVSHAPSRGTNRREDNPAQIEVEERTSHRAGLERGDACAERIDFGPSRARQSSCGPRANDKLSFRRT